MSSEILKKTYKIEKKYLWLPVKSEAGLKTLRFYDGDELVMEFRVPIDAMPNRLSKPTEFIGTLNVEKYIGKELTLEGEAGPLYFASVKSSDTPWKASCRRPFVHFTPDAGWMNDPNGLVYDGEYYHLFFQHNPLGKYWENMTWGHAVSKDLMHWEQKDDAMYPDEKGTMFSGCGFLDEKDELGFGENAKVFFYTTAGGTSEWSSGKHSVQCLAHLSDDGGTLVKDGTLIETIADANRDPKVYRYEEEDFYYMVLFIAEPDEFAVMNSADLRNWTETQRLHLPGLRECPDLRKIPAENGSEDDAAYVFSAADGTYYTGSFDGKCFVPEGGMKESGLTSLPYAAQTFYGTEKVIQIPWLRTKDPKKPYTSSMGIPRELTLAKNGDGEKVLLMKPAKAFNECAVVLKKGVLSLDAEDTSYISEKTDGEGAFEVRMTADRIPGFELVLFDTDLLYDAYTGELMFLGIMDGKTGEADIQRKREGKGYDPERPSVRRLQMPEELKELRVLIDGGILEITVNGGREVYIFELSKDQFSGHIDLEARGSMNYSISQAR